MIPAMKVHINQTFMVERSRAGSRGGDISVPKDEAQPIEDYSVTFRELFCIAASDLAEQLDMPLEDIGILYDEVFSTGQNARVKQKDSETTLSKSTDIERDGVEMHPLGRGQLLFLTKRIDRREAEHLQNAGFRFAGVQMVGDILSRSMQINCENLTQRLLTMRDYANESNILEPGVHLACFAIRASMRGGFDVLVRKDTRNQLPTMQMHLERLDGAQQEYLQFLDGMSVSQCLKSLKGKKAAPPLTAKEQAFTTHLSNTIEALRDKINDPFFNDAVLTSRTVLVPCRGADDESKPSQAQLIVFHILAPIHSRAPSQKLEFIPISFFKVQQHVYKNSPDHGIFARKIHREFGPILNQTHVSTEEVHGDNLKVSTFPRLGFPRKAKLDTHGQLEYEVPAQTYQPSPPALSQPPSHKFWQRKHRSRTDSIQSFSDRQSVRGPGISDSSSEKNLVEVQTFGGIMVSQEVSVDVRDLGNETTPGLGEGGEVTEMADLKVPRMGTLGTASKEDEDPETFVDRLFSICVEGR
jgi:hypothetical protein